MDYLLSLCECSSSSSFLLNSQGAESYNVDLTNAQSTEYVKRKMPIYTEKKNQMHTQESTSSSIKTRVDE